MDYGRHDMAAYLTAVRKLLPWGNSAFPPRRNIIHAIGATTHPCGAITHPCGVTTHPCGVTTPRAKRSGTQPPLRRMIDTAQ